MAKKKSRKRLPAIAEQINDATSLCREFAPNLVTVRATLLPFEDLILGQTAGPQPEAEDYDPSEEPYFVVEIDDASNRGGDTWARVTAAGVVISWDVPNGRGGLFHGGEIRTDLAGLWDFLRQLPRPATSFSRR